MKPNIFKSCGLWHCMFDGDFWAKSGLGFTPLQAYNDWLSMRAKHAQETCA